MKEPNEIPSNLNRGALPEPHMHRKNINRLIFSQLNINSLRNKFEFLQHIINKNIDVLLISETKIDSSFPSTQFDLEGYAIPYILDRNANGDVILLYIREDIPSKLLNTDSSIEIFFVEIRLRKKKWLLCSSYKPKKNLIANHLKNQASFIKSKIHKEVMRRTRLRNKFIDSKTDAERIAYNKQRNYCVSLIQKENKAYCSNLNIRDETDNKTFWRKVEPPFSEKVNLQTKILLVEKGDDLSDPEISSEVEKVISDMEIAETFNEYFVNIVSSLKISPKENYETDVGNDNESILNYINNFKNHPSIKVIKSRKKEEQTFTFSYVSYEEVLNEIRKLQTTKTTQ